jgi:hypothetical protein
LYVVGNDAKQSKAALLVSNRNEFGSRPGARGGALATTGLTGALGGRGTGTVRGREGCTTGGVGSLSLCREADTGIRDGGEAAGRSMISIDSTESS